MPKKSQFNPDAPIEKIVFEGGPCAGKTTGMEFTKNRLAEHGIMAVIIPEAVTLLKGNGLHPKNFDGIEYQRYVIDMQLSHEALYERMAFRLQQTLGKRVVLLCDRGLLSGAAYLPSSETTLLAEFQKQVLAPYQLSVEQVVNRYRGVVHLVTAADGAEAYFTHATNKEARDETPEQARALDIRSQLSWVGVDERGNIPNMIEGKSISFDHKMQLAAQEALRQLGIPYFIQAERKFLLKRFDPGQIPVPCEKVTIEQYYIPSTPRLETSVRKRTWMGHSSYHLRKKLPFIGSESERIKISSLIEKHEYLEFLRAAGGTLRHLSKDRYCFVLDHTYYKVDVFHTQNQPVLEVYGDKTLPDFFEVDREVTRDKTERNYVYAGN